jgi:hypothetical protein
MQQDAAIIAARLAPLAESGSSAASLEALVREKSIPRRDVGAAMRGLLRKSSNGPDVPAPVPEPATTPLSNGDEEGPVAEKRSSTESKSEEGKEASGAGAEVKAASRSPSKGWREVGEDTPSSPSPPLTSKSPVEEAKSEDKVEEVTEEEVKEVEEPEEEPEAEDDAPPPPSKTPSPPLKSPEPAEPKTTTSPPPPPPENDEPPATPAKATEPEEAPETPAKEASEPAEEAPATPAKEDTPAEP